MISVLNFNDYIKPEFLILVPVLWFLGWVIKKSQLKNCVIPFILCGVSVALCMIYLFATTDLNGVKSVLMCVFLSITQGVIATACAVFGDQMIKQAGEMMGFPKNTDDKNDNNSSTLTRK